MTVLLEIYFKRIKMFFINLGFWVIASPIFIVRKIEVHFSRFVILR